MLLAAFASALIAGSAAYAREPDGIFFSPAPVKPQAGYTMRYSPGTPSNAKIGSASMRFHSVNGSVPLNSNALKQWALSAKGEWLSIDTDMRLLETGAKVPLDFWNPQVGLAYRQSTTEDVASANIWTTSLQVGSPSDRPFSQLGLVHVNFTTSYSLAADSQSRYLFFLNYSNWRAFLPYIPLPGFAYSYAPSPSFRLVVGVPFVSLNWKPTAKSDLLLSYFGPYTGIARFSYSVYGPFALFAQADAQQMIFARHDRTDDRDKFFYDEKRVAIGVRAPLAAAAAFDFMGGNSFNRRIFEGRRYSEPRGGSRQGLDNTWFIQGNLSLRF